MDRLRVAVIGAGYFAGFHYEAWARHPRAELVGACDLDAAKAEAMATAHGGAAFTDPARMIAALRPDLVDIATPPQTHLDLVRMAGAAGVDIVCQKPLAPTLEEARQVVTAAEDAGVRLIVHENFRFQPWYRETRRLIDDGLFGRPHGIAFRLRPGDGQGADAYLARQPYFQKMARFLIHETGVHFIDVFRYLLGEITGVSAVLRRLNPAIAGEDAGHAIFDFESGASGLFDGNRLNGHDAANPRLTMGEMTLEGSAGVLSLDGYGRLFWQPQGGDRREHVYRWRDRGFGGDCVYALQDHVVRRLLDGAPVENAGRDYLRNVEIVDAVYRAHEEGRRLEIA